MKRNAKNGRFCKNQPGAGLRAFHAAGVKQNNDISASTSMTSAAAHIDSYVTGTAIDNMNVTQVSSSVQ